MRQRIKTSHTCISAIKSQLMFSSVMKRCGTGINSLTACTELTTRTTVQVSADADPDDPERGIADATNAKEVDLVKLNDSAQRLTIPTAIDWYESENPKKSSKMVSFHQDRRHCAGSVLSWAWYRYDSWSWVL